MHGMRRVVGVTVGLLMMTPAIAAADHAQRVADLQAILETRTQVGQSTDGTQDELDEAVDRWLRGELKTIRKSSSNAAISQALLVAAEARTRHRPRVAAEADARLAAMIEERYSELPPLVESGDWAEALARIEAWVPGAATVGQARKAQLHAQVERAIFAAEAKAMPGPEHFLFARMHGWLRAEAATPEDAAMGALATPAITLERAPTPCPVATSLTHASSDAGTPATVELEVGSCPVIESRGSVNRTGSYMVETPREREESYTVTERSQVNVPTTRQECNQETYDISGGVGPKNYITTSKCKDVGASELVTVETPVTKTRVVSYIDRETLQELYTVSTIDASADVAVTVTVMGDGETVTLSERPTASEHDESYSSVHSGSQSFRTDLAQVVRDQLESSAQAAANRALDAWAVKRGATRLARARAAADAPTQRALAVEAVRIAPTLAESALPLVLVRMTADQLAALVAGTPRIDAMVLEGGRGLALPSPSAGLAKDLAELEDRHSSMVISGGRDGFFGMGVGVSKLDALDNAPSFALELQYGRVAGFTATSHFRARIELEFQLLAGRDPQLESAVRPEAGLSFGLLDLGVVGIAGGRYGYIQVEDDPDLPHDHQGTAFAGYGAHATLRPGKLLLDAMALRLHQTGEHAHATRLDGSSGIT